MDVSKAAKDCAKNIGKAAISYDSNGDATFLDYRASPLIQAAMDKHAECRCAELREALQEAYQEQLYLAYNVGFERDDGTWTHAFMSDGEWLADQLGLDSTKADWPAPEVKALMGTACHPLLRAAKPANGEAE